MGEEEKLTKVHIDLPHHWGTGGEAMWAVDLGADLYELRNTPFYAYDLNFGDVVRATADSPDLKPEVRSVVRRSGHNTIRVFFEKGGSREARLQLLASLKPLSVSFEIATEHFVALDLEPEANVTRVREELDRWHAEGLAAYETCEARVPGSFDDELEASVP
jgi:hypothetical protein